MADELASLIEEFVNLGKNYCRNAQVLLSDVEKRKVVDIYEAGLDGAMEGLSQDLRSQYAALSPEQKAAVDEAVAKSGTLSMLRVANEKIGGGTLLTGPALLAAGGIFHKVKKWLRRLLTIEEGGWLDNGLEFIDDVIENIGELLPG